MQLKVRKKAQLLMITGMSVLVIASTMLTQQHSDFVYGSGFGIGIGLLLLSVYSFRQK